MSQLGWGPGIVVLVLSWSSRYTLSGKWLRCTKWSLEKRFDRYHELGQHAFGEKLGLWIIVPQQLVVEVGTCIVYMVTGGKSLKKFHDLVCSDCKEIRTTYFIMMFAAVHFVLSHLPNFNSISGVSLAAAVMSLVYSTIAWVASVKRGVQPNVSYAPRSTSTSGIVFDFFSALGNVAFAYAGHNVVLEIQATMPSTPEKPSKVPMWRGVVVAYIVVAICYFPVAVLGYYMFGNSVDDNILMTLQKPAWLVAAANLFVFIHVIGGYQIFAMPVFDMMETFLVKKQKFQPSALLRFLTRNLFVAITMFIGIMLPFFGGFARLLWRFCFRPNFILYSLHHVAQTHETKEVQHFLVRKLVLHCVRHPVDHRRTHRWAERDHHLSQKLQDVLLIQAPPTKLLLSIVHSYTYLGSSGIYDVYVFTW
ncbi:unnamed protein product [Rhodiola kirilowii]